MGKMSGKAAMIDKAQSKVPSDDRRQAPAGTKSKTASAVGNEMKADLAGAMSELKTQHPIHYSDRGPHHGGTTHVRHSPVVKDYGR